MTVRVAARHARVFDFSRQSATRYACRMRVSAQQLLARNDAVSHASLHSFQIDASRFRAQVPPLLFGLRRNENLFFRSAHQFQRVL